jgi:hypothetical protein
MMLCPCGKTALFIRGSGAKSGRCREHKDALDSDSITARKQVTRGRTKKARKAKGAAEAAETTTT